MDKSEGIWVIMLLKDFLVSTRFTFSILNKVLHLCFNILFLTGFKQEMSFADWFLGSIILDLSY